MNAKHNLKDRRFGRWTVLFQAESRNKRRYWHCRCDCGIEDDIAADSLKAKVSPSRSCGCLRRDRAVAKQTTHGKSDSLEWRLWWAANEAARRHEPPLFDLTLDDIVIPSVCPLLGIPLDREAKSWTSNKPSLDRVDPRRGYTKDNVWVVSWRANRIKSDATLKELQNMVEALSAKLGVQ